MTNLEIQYENTIVNIINFHFNQIHIKISFE